MPYMGEPRERALVNTIGLINDRPTGKKDKMKSADYAVKSVVTGDKIAEDEAAIAPSNGEPVDAIERPSRPPTPPTRPDSPYKLPCPPRLTPFTPPPNFGAVMDHKVFRSAFPQKRNIDFLISLGVKTMLVFVDTEPDEHYATYVQENGVKLVRVAISPNKEGKVNTSVDSICQALLLIVDAANYPLYIHCNQGRHRTGCVIACLRKVQGWPIEAVLAEYHAYASPKSRPGDIKFITEVFQPEALVQYAKQHGHFEDRPALMQLLRSNLVTVDKLVDILASTDGIAASNASLKSEQSKPDSGIDLSLDPANFMATRMDISPGEAEVSVTECDAMSPPVNTAHAGPFFSHF